MKNKITLAVCIGLTLFGSNLFAAMTGTEILIASDKKLLPTYCSYNLLLETTENDGSKSANTIEGYKKENARNVMLVTDPPKVAGSVHMRKELVIWSYYITDKKLVKVAYSSSFMGTLLNYGDVMATELSYDYNVTDMKTTTTDYILTLKVKKDHEGYAKVVVTVAKATLYPNKREFYAASGELMKTCTLQQLSRNGDQTTLMQQKYTEPLKNRFSIATYSNIKYVAAAAIPDRYYNENEIQSMGG
jgi:hypothetical protein